jgi:hypothetical protein
MKKILLGITLLFIGFLFLKCGEILDDPPGSSLNVTDVTINVTSGTSVTLIWNSDIPSTHLVEYGTTSGTYTTNTSRTTTASTSHTEVISVGSGATYYLRVKNFAEGADDYTSREYSFSTSSTINPTGLSVSSITDTGATITWTTSTAVTHVIEYGTSSGNYTFSTVEGTSTVNSETLTGLTAGTLYYYRIKCFHATLTDANSVEGNFSTTGGTHPTLAEKLRGIWIVGGSLNMTGTTFCTQLDLYDPVTRTWYPDVASGASGTAPTGTAFPMVASLNGNIYIIGGAVSNAVTTNLVYEYNVSTNTWSYKTVIPYGNVMDGAVYTHAGRIYILGGTTSVTAAGVTTAHYYFDPTGSGTWSSALTVVPVAKAGAAVYNFSGTVAYTGGRLLAGTGTNLTDIYQPVQNAYSGATEQVINAAVFGAAYAGYSGTNGSYLFIVGGATATTAATAYFGLTATLTYVPQANSWEVYTPPATATGVFNAQNSTYYHPAFTGATTIGLVFASAVVSPYNGSTTVNPTLYVFGGIKGTYISSQTLTVTNEYYYFSANGTTSGTNYIVSSAWANDGQTMSRPRYGHRAVTINQ